MDNLEIYSIFKDKDREKGGSIIDLVEEVLQLLRLVNEVSLKINKIGGYSTG